MGLTKMIGNLRKEIKDGKPRTKNDEHAKAYSEEHLAAKRKRLDELLAKRAKHTSSDFCAIGLGRVREWEALSKLKTSDRAAKC